MTQSEYDLIVRIIGLPKRHQSANASIYALLKYSGYFEIHDHITVESIREVLAERPGHVDDWIQYSGDKRCDSGWLVRQNGADYEVGYYSRKTRFTQTSNYSDPVEACATFIKKELEDVRIH